MKKIMIPDCAGFDWDEWNLNKSWNKHNVSCVECEQVFFNQPLLLYDDSNHSKEEIRMYVLGKTNNARLLFIVFTIRNSLIRVISARDMNKKEKVIYEEKTRLQNN